MQPADQTPAESAEALALRMFPSMAPPAATQAPAAPQLPTAAPAAGGQAPASQPEVDADMKAVREDPAYRMFGVSEAARALPDNLFANAIGQTIEVDGAQVQIDEEIARSAVSELRVMAADLDLKASDMEAVNAGLAFGRTLLGDEQKTIEAREAAVDLLNTQFGQEAALAALCARVYVSKNAKLANLLERTGAGDSPQVVGLVAKRALALHKAGKLTLPAAQRPHGAGLYGASKMNP